MPEGTAGTVSTGLSGEVTPGQRPEREEGEPRGKSGKQTAGAKALRWEWLGFLESQGGAAGPSRWGRGNSGRRNGRLERGQEQTCGALGAGRCFHPTVRGERYWSHGGL